MLGLQGYSKQHKTTEPFTHDDLPALDSRYNSDTDDEAKEDFEHKTIEQTTSPQQVHYKRASDNSNLFTATTNKTTNMCMPQVPCSPTNETQELVSNTTTATSTKLKTMSLIPSLQS